MGAWRRTSEARKAREAYLEVDLVSEPDEASQCVPQADVDGVYG